MIENDLIKLLGEDFYKICDVQDLLSKSIVLTSILFHNVIDKSGEPYFNHLFRVMQNCQNSQAKVVAMLHDTLEDTLISYRDLIILGFPKDIVDIVLLLTKKPEENYDDYINKILSSKNPVALEVKYNDMLDNSNPSRLEKLSPEQQKRLTKKYQVIGKIKERMIKND